MSKTRVQPMVEWHSINWRKLERRVFKLQKRIYRASQRGDVKAVRRLQWNSESNKPLQGLTLFAMPVGKYQSGKNNGNLLGFKTLITPSQEKQKIHYEQVAKTICTGV